MSLLKDMRHAYILGAFCLVFGLLLAATKKVTANDIDARALEDRMASLEQVLPHALHDNDPLKDTLAISRKDGKTVTVFRARQAGKITGVAFQIEGSGYAGPIRLMIGMHTDGSIIGVRVLAHKETPGLGDRIDVKKSDWILKFSGLSLDKPNEAHWKVKKDGGDFDQFAGATITPRGVVKAVHEGLQFFAENRAAILGGAQ
ncbi:MAG: electron transport complex subunit RsxG [Formivibrio sp.]|nr:electron transport complex subunit RsxG [Formivibrio sp.]